MFTLINGQIAQILLANKALNQESGLHKMQMELIEPHKQQLIIYS
jgi:hypothetical protein